MRTVSGQLKALTAEVDCTQEGARDSGMQSSASIVAEFMQED